MNGNILCSFGIGFNGTLFSSFRPGYDRELVNDIKMYPGYSKSTSCDHCLSQCEDLLSQKKNKIY